MTGTESAPDVPPPPSRRFGATAVVGVLGALALVGVVASLVTISMRPTTTPAATPAPKRSPIAKPAPARRQPVRRVVARGSILLSVGTTWDVPGDVRVTLVSPRGRRINRNTRGKDVTATRTASAERLVVFRPEPGPWTIASDDTRLVAPGGYTQDVRVQSSKNRDPVAVALVTRASHEGRTIWVDGSESRDPDGGNLSYEWDFGDGTTSTDASTSHTYAHAGTFSPVLTVRDTEAGAGVDDAGPIFVDWDDDDHHWHIG